MNPFDICFVRTAVVPMTPEEKAAKLKEDRKQRKRELARELAAASYGKGSQEASRKRGANPEYKKKSRVVEPAVGEVATPRTRNWKEGTYKPSVQMRDAIDRAKAEQPALMSLTTKELK